MYVILIAKGIEKFHSIVASLGTFYPHERAGGGGMINSCFGAHESLMSCCCLYPV